jgi:serine/threonine protein kinase
MAEEKVLRASTGTRASVKLVRFGGELAVLKDYRDCSPPMRVVGRWLISREMKAVSRLSGVEGIPRCLGRPDPYCFLIQHIEGKSVFDLRREDMPPDLLDRLRRLVDQVHSRGVVHCDMKHPDNLIISPAGQPHLVDWGTALLRPPRFNFIGRWIYSIFESDDIKAIHKMRYYTLPGLRPEEWEGENLRTMGPLERIARAIRDALRSLARRALSDWRKDPRRRR